MTVEIGAAQILGFLLTLISTAGGIWLRRLNAALDESRARVEGLQKDLLTLQTLLATQAHDYCRRAEMAEFINRIEAKIDRLSDKLDQKQDRAAAAPR